MFIGNAEHKIKLRRLLSKLGVQAAKVDYLEEAMINMANNFGKPDQLVMDPHSFELMKKFSEVVKGKKNK